SDRSEHRVSRRCQQLRCRQLQCQQQLKPGAPVVRRWIPRAYQTNPHLYPRRLRLRQNERPHKLKVAARSARILADTQMMVTATTGGPVPILRSVIMGRIAATAEAAGTPSVRTTADLHVMATVMTAAAGRLLLYVLWGPTARTADDAEA
ncbi:MAG: hypothetical protein ACI9KE_005588, partial [Polyangiales bacterium]